NPPPASGGGAAAGGGGRGAGEKGAQAGAAGPRRIRVACGFHSPLIAGARAPLAEALAAVRFAAPRRPVYSNTTAAPHGDPAGIGRQLAEHLVAPVRFAAEVEALYAAGARVFVEVGPQAVLTGLAQQTLADRPHLAVASDVKARPGLVQLAHLLGQLLAHGVLARLDRLFQGRGVRPFDLGKLGPDFGPPKPPPTAWVVNGTRSRPVNGPEPRLLGQALPPNPAAAAPKPAAPSPPSPVTGRATMSQPEPAPALPVPGTNRHAPQPTPDGAAQVMLRFQDVMARFLETQRSVMLGFLRAGGG